MFRTFPPKCLWSKQSDIMLLRWIVNKVGKIGYLDKPPHTEKEKKTHIYTKLHFIHYRFIKSVSLYTLSWIFLLLKHTESLGFTSALLLKLLKKFKWLLLWERQCLKHCRFRSVTFTRVSCLHELPNKHDFVLHHRTVLWSVMIPDFRW